MTSHDDEELISAYLDGELEPAERARIEQKLSISAELRQLCDELRALSAGMQALPRHKLTADLGPLVLRRAERATLAGPAGRASSETASVVRSWWLRGAGWRRLAWPAVVAAAALLIYAFDPSPKPAERQVAQTPPSGEMSIGAPRDAALADENAPAQLAAPASPPATAPAVAEKAAASPNRAMTSAKSGDAAIDNLSERQATSGARMRALARKAEQSDAVKTTIVCRVRSQFVGDRAFEKLLDDRKIAWRGPAEEDAKRAEPGPRSEYVIDLNAEQLDAVMSDLRKRSPDVAQINVESASSDAKDTPASRIRVRFLLQVDEPGP